MKKYILLFVFGLIGLLCFAQNNKHLFMDINGTVGNHTIIFKDFANSAGLSFGYAINLGIYAVNKGNYNGGLYFGFLEAASRDEKRRELSENFILPNRDFDKHIIFKFAQFRSGNIGWFNEYYLNNKLGVYHSLGFGIFGTTEKDQLLDFGMSQQLGFLIGENAKFRMKLGLVFDTTFGTGNPNYLQRNIGLNIGGSRSF